MNEMGASCIAPVSATVIAGGGAAPGNGKVCQRRRCLALDVDQRRSGLESRVPASTAATA